MSFKEQKKNKQRRQRNKKYVTSIKNFLKTIRTNLERSANLKNLKEVFIKLQSRLDKAVRKGIIHQNKADRHKHRLSKRIKNKEIA